MTQTIYFNLLTTTEEETQEVTRSKLLIREARIKLKKPMMKTDPDYPVFWCLVFFLSP